MPQDVTGIPNETTTYINVLQCHIFADVISYGNQRHVLGISWNVVWYIQNHTPMIRQFLSIVPGLVLLGTCAGNSGVLIHVLTSKLVDLHRENSIDSQVVHFQFPFGK